jgi:DNA gyrase subunit A
MNTDCIVGALSVDPDSEILMITSNGQAVRCPVDNIRETNRGSKGVKLVNLNDKDKLIAISEVIELDETEKVVESESEVVELDESEKVSESKSEESENDSSDSKNVTQGETDDSNQINE